MVFPKQRIRLPKEDQLTIISEWLKIAESGQYAYGPWVDRFEKAWAGVCGTRYAIATGSGTQALEMMVRALRLRGKRVAIPANTYIATAQAILHAGASVAMVDVDHDLMLNPDSLPKTQDAIDAIMVVHIGGNISDRLGEVKEYCSSRNIPLLEDAAHAHGVGGHLGKAAAFSFFPTKLITVGGEGGMLTTDDPSVAEFAYRFRHHGREKQSHDTMSDVVLPGHNYCLDEMRALVGWTQVQRLRQYIEVRAKVAEVYREWCGLIESETTNFYKILTYDPPTIPDDLLPSKVYARPIHLEPMFGYREGMYPMAEKLCRAHHALPVYNDMTVEEAEEAARWVFG